MQRGIAIAALAVMLFPASAGFSQLIDTDPTLGIKLTSFSPYHYKSEDGRTVIIGEVENTKDFPVTGIKIWAGFFDSAGSAPLESTIGTSLLDVIPPKSTSPYVIYSGPNPEIANVSVNLLGFNSAGPKISELSLDEGSVEITDRFSYTGSITNMAGIATGDVRIHLVVYDSFEPPRLLKASTVELDILGPESSADYEFDEQYMQRAAGFYVLAESADFLSNMVDMEITQPESIAKKISINSISLSDPEGNKISSGAAGSPIVIQSNLWIRIASQNEAYDQDYVYYSQVKQSGEQAHVEFIGTFEGSFDGPASQDPAVQWVPENSGLYFIETFVWDPDGVPLASKGPIILVLVK